MVIDTSALFAIEFQESDAAALDEVIRSAGVRVISAAAAVEPMVALSRRRHAPQQHAVEDLLSGYAIEVAPVDTVQVSAAWDGFARFGQGGESGLSVLNSVTASATPWRNP